MTTQMLNSTKRSTSSLEDHPAWHNTCQDCHEVDEFLMTFEARTIPARWLCSSCYWKQITHYVNSHKN